MWREPWASAAPGWLAGVILVTVMTNEVMATVMTNEVMVTVMTNEVMANHGDQRGDGQPW